MRLYKHRLRNLEKCYGFHQVSSNVLL
ncbi:MAG: hypothetical protein EBW00_03565 [Proteobacteria bacterium]|nr:hypothetical protein [Pseudomonadota bacterium]NCW11174.1 hypothetical protein [Pseudomonadota bacterium]NCW38078.1 hypothetical protein [Pseudomonadota bacterium]NCX42673.1 hypothetical protein [Pseudomonadota bacterium]NDE95055.1 hypothetical protein [Pseudomonadota bacterium]